MHIYHGNILTYYSRYMSHHKDSNTVVAKRVLTAIVVAATTTTTTTTTTTFTTATATATATAAS